jgi:PhnB protein
LTPVTSADTAYWQLLERMIELSLYAERTAVSETTTIRRFPVIQSPRTQEYSSPPHEGGLVMSVKPIPDGYHAATPYLIVKGAEKAIDFYKRAFDATETMRMPGPDGSVMHAEIKIGDSHIMLADEHPGMGYRGPQALGGTPVSMMLYVEDVDARFKKAVAAGATVRRELTNQFYGDRSGTLEDPFGHVWTLATHVEDVPPDEMRRRGEALSKQHGEPA